MPQASPHTPTHTHTHTPPHATTPPACRPPTQVKYVARTAAKGGLISDTRCTMRGATKAVPYTGTWVYLTC